MIVRRSLRLKWFIQIEGWNLLFFVFYGYLVCVLNLQFFFELLAFPFTGISVIGTAVAILLGFRNNEAYGRFWEARTAWGDLTNASRNFASQVIGYIQPPIGQELQSEPAQDYHRELIYRHLAFVNALRLQLRQEETWEELKPFLSESEFQELPIAVNKATLLNHGQSLRLRELYSNGWILQRAYVLGLMETIKEFFTCQGKCERIKNTPLPRPYGIFTKAFVWVFVLLLPFGLIQHLGWGTLPIYVVLATIFTIIERIGRRTEDPFENKFEDIPMTALCRNIEIDLRQQLGESSIPPPMKPVDGILL
jgi:putative membrane protein